MFELKNIRFEVEKILKIEDYAEYVKAKKELLKNVKKAIASGEDPNESNDRTPLIWASYLGDFELVKTLVKAGADVNKPSDLGVIPLMETNNIDVVNYLIKKGTDFEGNAYKLLTSAIDDENMEKLEILLENLEDGDINEGDKLGDTALHFAAREDAPLEFVEILVDNGIDWKIKNKHGDTALDLAIEEDVKEYLKSLG